MNQGRQRERHRHEVDERAVHDSQHVGGIPVGPDPVGFEPDEPGEQAHECRVHQLHGAVEPALGDGADHPIDEIHDRVLVGEGDERQAREDQHEQHQLGDFEGAAQRPVEDVARHHVGHGEGHHQEEDGGSGDAEERVGAPLPPLLGRAHLLAATFFSSSRNSVRILEASSPLALAAVIHSSMIGAERFLTSATNAASALTILTPDFLSASMPLPSAASHELPARRAMCSPEIFSMASRSPLASLFHLSSFMKNPKAELYMPPGNSVAWASTVSSLNEVIDTNGKKTPSATPELRSS